MAVAWSWAFDTPFNPSALVEVANLKNAKPLALERLARADGESGKS
jgi:hypothetical protein